MTSKETGTEIAARSRLDDDTLRGIGSFSDALALANSSGEVIDASDFGTGFDVVKADTLDGVPFVVLAWQFNAGEFGPFVSMTLVTEDGRKCIVNDGSTGVCEQVLGITRAKYGDAVVGDRDATPPVPAVVYGPMVVRKGFRVSRFKYTDDDGKSHPASVTYLNL